MNQNTKSSFFQKIILFIIMLIAAILAPLALGRYEQHTLIMVVFFAFAASAWNIVCGFVGTVSLGHAIFLGVGAYTSTLLLLYTNLSPWIGMFAGAVVAAIFGVLIGYPCFKLKGPYFTLTTIAFGELIRIWVENNESLFGIDIKGSMGLLLPQTGNNPVKFEFSSKLPYYYVMLAFLIIVLLITQYIKTHKLGYYLTAIKSDPDAAESLGIPLAKYKLIAMIISTFLMAFAGTFYAQYYRYVGPTRVFGHDLSVQIALIALIGGQGTVLGPLFGAVLLVPVSELLSEKFGGALPGLHLFIYGVIMILVIHFMQNGIHGYVIKLYEKIKSLFTKNKKLNKARS